MRLAVLLTFCLSGAVFGQDAPKSNNKAVTLCTVGKAKVSTDEFAYLFQKNHQHKKEDFTAAKVEEYLELYVNFKVKVAEALSRGMDTTKSFQQEFDQYREEIKKPYVSEGDELDRLVKEAYQRSKEIVRASNILIMLKADATPADTLAAWNKITEVRKKALAGGDFAELAKEFSEDPSAKGNGGDLGYFSVMEMVYPFETMAYQTKVGEISPIVRTRFGYHIIKVIDHRSSPGEVEVSHIMLLTGKGDDSKARNTAFELSDQLKAGAKWEELCKQYSEDPNTKNNGGRLRQFGLGTFTTSAPEFEKAALALQNPGDISDPIQTPFGWHIIRLEKKFPVPEFKEAQPALTRKIARDDRLQLSKAARISKMKSQFGFLENREVKTKVLTLADSSLMKGKWMPPKVNLDGPLCEVRGKKIAPSEFLTYAESSQTINNQAPKLYMEQLYDKWVERILNVAEEEKLIQEKPEFKSMLNEYREGILLFTIMEQEIWNRASNDSIGQQKFYAANTHKYKAGDRVRARIFSTNSKAILDELKAKIAIGDTLQAKDLKKLKSVSNFRSYEKSESKVIDKTPWAVGLHELELEGIFYLVEVSQLIPPGIKSFEDARANVISDYQDQLEKEWLVVLKNKYPVSINAKAKKAVIQELTAKK
jgi:peptidyl-prolyl cis-trans isomerase SurA